MTQDELADLLGVTTRSVQGYEAGDVVPWKHFQRLEDVFQRPLQWFLHGDSERGDLLEEIAERLRRIEELVSK